jgi:MtrB/PioB family decaheme-associated outer membrane protein
LLAGLPAVAQETSGDAGSSQGFTFRLDPLVLGAIETHVDTDSSKFQEYRDLSSGFVLPLLRLEGEAGDRELDFQAINASRHDARYTLSYGVLGRYNFLLDYNKIQHRFGNNGHMLWTRSGPGRLEISDPVQGALQNAIIANQSKLTFPFLNGLLAPYLATANEVDLGLQRDRTLARFGMGTLAGFAWDLEYTHENRTGNRAYGGSFGFSNATELPEPIDYDTSGAELAGEWSGKNAGLRIGYRYSKFENNISTLIWDNPFRLTPATDPNAYTAPGAGSVGGSNLGIADLAADNRANLVFVNGRARLGGSWFVNGSASYNVMKQNDPLLPYTLNSAIQGIDEHGAKFDPTNVANLPTRNADSEADVLNVTAQAGTRFADRFDLTFRYRLYDYDNQSKRIEFPGYVRFHAVWEAIPRITVPFAYKKQDLGAELGWDLARSSRLAFSYNLQSWDRKFREVNSTDEDILRLTFDTHPSPMASLRASYEHGDRSIGRYNPDAQGFSFGEPEALTNQPGLRKFDEAARTYNQYNVLGQLTPGDAWSFSLGATGRKDDYDKSEFGLVSDDVKAYNAELGYSPGDNVNLYLFGERTDRESFQRSRQSGATPSTNPADNWQAKLDEVNDLWGLGMTNKIGPRWSTDLSARWSKADGTADLFSPPGGTPDKATGFDNYQDVKLFSIQARVEYQLDAHAKAGLSYLWEDYNIDTFILQGLANYLPGTLLLNPDYGDYQGNVVGVDMTFSF